MALRRECIAAIITGLYVFLAGGPRGYQSRVLPLSHMGQTYSPFKESGYMVATRDQEAKSPTL